MSTPSQFYPDNSNSDILQQLQTINSLVPSTYDYIELDYTGSDITTVIYKVGGATGSVVSTLNLTYDGSHNLLTVTKV